MCIRDRNKGINIKVPVRTETPIIISPICSPKISLENIPINTPTKTIYDNILTKNFKWFNLINLLIVL